MSAENMYGIDINNDWWFVTLIDLDKDSFIEIMLTEKSIDVDVHDYSYI